MACCRSYARNGIDVGLVQGEIMSAVLAMAALELLLESAVSLS
jgi:hypothetical protein